VRRSSWDMRGMADGLGRVGLGWRLVPEFRRLAAGCVRSRAQGGVYPGVGDRLVVAQALGGEAEQELDAVPGPLSDSWCGYPGRQPEGDSRVPHFVGAASQGRGDLGRGEGANAGPHIADGGGSDGVAAFATEPDFYHGLGI